MLDPIPGEDLRAVLVDAGFREQSIDSWLRLPRSTTAAAFRKSRDERLIDPLKAVPELPFGHLHAAWLKFVEGVTPEDAIWSFSAKWTNGWGRKELMAGYAVVRGDSIGPHFLTLWKSVDRS